MKQIIFFALTLCLFASCSPEMGDGPEPQEPCMTLIVDELYTIQTPCDWIVESIKMGQDLHSGILANPTDTIAFGFGDLAFQNLAGIQATDNTKFIEQSDGGDVTFIVKLDNYPSAKYLLVYAYDEVQEKKNRFIIKNPKDVNGLVKTLKTIAFSN